jgi:ketosteroid isomerase-like protein
VTSNTRQALIQFQERWLNLELTGRSEELLGLCTDDVVWFPPERKPLVGKLAVKAYLESARYTKIVSIELSDLFLKYSTDLAIKRANFKTTIVIDGQHVVIQGTHLWTLIRAVDAVDWRISNLVWFAS